MSEEDTVKHLWDCATRLDADTHAKRLLKSYYLNNCRKIASIRLEMPKEKFSVSQMCPRCSSFWAESEPRLSLRPQGVRRNAKNTKLIAKLEESLATQKKDLLTKKQRRRAKWLKKRSTCNLQILCGFCKEKSIVPLEKPKKKATPAVEVERETAPTVITKTKKKKPKNKTAGLKIEAIKQHAKRVKAKQTNIKPVSAVKDAEPTLKKAALSQPPSKTKPKKKKKNPQSAQAVAPKNQSKTQQRNSLLQLAALLKAQGTKSATNTSKNRLDSLLK